MRNLFMFSTNRIKNDLHLLSQYCGYFCYKHVVIEYDYDV